MEVEIVQNDWLALASALPAAVNRGIRKQIFVTEGDVKVNVQTYDVIDTGNLLGSIRAEMLDRTTGMVSVSAESEQGFPYPWIQNYGGRYIAPRPFFSDAEAKARDEFPGRMKREIDAALR